MEAEPRLVRILALGLYCSFIKSLKYQFISDFSGWGLPNLVCCLRESPKLNCIYGQMDPVFPL